MDEQPGLSVWELVMVITKTGEHNPKLFNMEENEFLEKVAEWENQMNINEG